MSPTRSIPTWNEDNKSLHNAICEARVSKDSVDSLKQLLRLNKQKFLDLLDSQLKDTSHRNNLNASRCIKKRIVIQS
jgi:nuclear pore complex protein Nup205